MSFDKTSLKTYDLIAKHLKMISSIREVYDLKLPNRNFSDGGKKYLFSKLFYVAKKKQKIKNLKTIHLLLFSLYLFFSNLFYFTCKFYTQYLEKY